MPAIEAIARISTKAELVLPKKVREKLGVGQGDLVRFVERNGAIVIERFEPDPFEDPFRLFDEWASPADCAAFDDWQQPE